MTLVHAFLTRSSRCHGHEFFNIGLSCRQNRCDDSSTLGRKLISVSTADFLDYAVCPEQPQGAADTSALPSLLGCIRRRTIKRSPHVAIAETAYGPLTAIDKLQQRCIRFRPRIKRAIPSLTLLNRPANCFDQLSRALSSTHTGQGFQIATVNRLADLRASVQITDSFAQNLPALLAFGNPFAGSIDSELVRTVHRGFYPQHTALLIIEFNRVAVGLMFEPQAFGTAFKAAEHLALVITVHPSIGLGLVSQKAQHISAPKMFDALMHQGGVKPFQSVSTLKHDVGRILTFGDAPVVGEPQRLSNLCPMGVALLNERLQQNRPAAFQLSTAQCLGLGQIFDPRKAVFPLKIVDPALIHLATQPIPP